MPHFDEPTSTSKLSFQMAALSSYIKELKAHFENTIDGANEEMQEKIKDLQQKIEDALRSLEDAKQSAAENEEKLKDIENSLDAINQDLEVAEKKEEDPETIKDMLKQRDEYEATREKVTSEYEEARSNLEKTAEHVDEVRRNAYERVSNLVTEIYEFTSDKIKSAEAKQEEATVILSKIDDSIKKYNDSKAKTEDEMKASDEEYEVSSAEAYKSYEEQSSEFADKSDAMAEEHEARIAELKKSLEGADEEKAAEIETKIAVLTKEYKDEVEKFDQYKKEFKEEFSKEQADNEKKHEEKKAEMASDIKAIESKIESTESEKEGAIVKLKEAVVEVDKFKKLCLDVLNPAYEWLNEEYEEFTNYMASLKKESADFAERLDNTKAEIAKTMEEVKKNATGSMDAQQTLAGFEQGAEEKNTEYNESTKKFEAQMSELKSKMEGAAEEDLAEMEAEIEDLQAQREEEVARLKKEINDINNQIDYWTTKNDEYVKAIKSAVETNKKLQAEEEEYKDIISDIENRLSSTDAAISILQEPYGVVEKIYSEKYPSEEAFAWDGYYPLYKFEYNAAAASPNGSGTHSHSFEVDTMNGIEKVTYYMPNGLNMDPEKGKVTQWHGDYGKKEEEPVKREPDLGQGVFLGNVVGLHGGGGNGAMFGDQLRESFSGTAVEMNLVTPNGGYEVGPDAYTWLPVVDKEAGETTTAVDVARKSVEAIRSAILKATMSHEITDLGDAQAALNAEAPLEAVPVEEFENVEAFEKAEVEREVEEDNGVTLIGYSDGAAMIPVLLKRLRDLEDTKVLGMIKRVVFIKGYVEGERHQGLAIPENYTPFTNLTMASINNDPLIKAYFIAGQNDDGFYQSTLDARGLFNEPQSTITNGDHEFEVAGLLSWAREVIPQPAAELNLGGMDQSMLLRDLTAISAYHNNGWNGRHGNDPAPPIANEDKWNAFLKSFLSPDEEGVVEMIEQMEGGDPLYRINVQQLEVRDVLDPMAKEVTEAIAGDKVGDGLKIDEAFIYIGNVAEGTPILGTVVERFDIGEAPVDMMAVELSEKVEAADFEKVALPKATLAFMDAKGNATSVQFNADDESPFMTKLLTTFFNAFYEGVGEGEKTKEEYHLSREMDTQEMLNALGEISKFENHSWSGRQVGAPDAGSQGGDEEKWNLFLKYFLYNQDESGVVEMIDMEGETQYRINISSAGEGQSIIIGSATFHGTTQLDFGHEEITVNDLPANQYGFYNNKGEFVAGFVISRFVAEDVVTNALIARLVDSYKAAGYNTTIKVQSEHNFEEKIPEGEFVPEGEMLEKEIAEKEADAATFIPSYVSIFEGLSASQGHFRSWILNRGAAEGLPIVAGPNGVWSWEEEGVVKGETQVQWFAQADSNWRISKDMMNGSLTIGVGIDQYGRASEETEGRTYSNINFEKYDPIFTKLLNDMKGAMMA